MDIQQVLKEHAAWVYDNTTGIRADLTGENLTEAHLTGAKLTGADLTGAKLTGADLTWANLREADLTWANLRGANLREAHLRGAKLTGADLTGADLTEADLTEADLTEAYLAEADLTGAKLTGAKLPHFQIIPSTGRFRAWKKTTTGVIEIEIPAGAKRTCSLVGRKCRAEFIKVIFGPGCGGQSPTYSDRLTYGKGEIVQAHDFSNDIRIECAPGIHFFVTKEEAEQW